MTKSFKLLLLFISVCTLISLCVMPSFADETGALNTGTSPISNETSAPSDITNPPVPTPIGVEITARGKSEYTEGETFDPQGFTLKIKYENGEREAPLSEATAAHSGALTLGTSALSYTIEGFNFELPVTVTPKQKAVDKIEITSTKTDYLALDRIDRSTLTVTVFYKDGTSEPLALDACTFTPALDTPLSASTAALNVSYGIGEGQSVSAALPIHVTPIYSIDIEGISDITLYQAHPFTKPDGMTVIAYYDDEYSVSKVITDYEIASSEFVTIDADKKFAVTLTADTCTEILKFKVREIVNYTVTGVKSVYYYGDAFVKDGIKVNAVYEDLTTYDVTSQVVISAPDVIVAGSKIVFTHDGFDLTECVNTELPVGTLTILMNPLKLQYNVGETFDSTGMVVVIQYSNGTRKALGDGDYQLVVSNPLTAADTTVTITYFGATAGIPITVGSSAYIVSMNIISAPEVLEYFEGGHIDTTGLIVEVLLSDGTKKIADNSTLTFTPALDASLTADITKVVISANDGDAEKYCSVSYPIFVTAKKPVALVMISSPDKVKYKEGETFNPTGLKLNLLYNDGTMIETSAYSFSPSLETAFVLQTSATEKVIVYAVYRSGGVKLTYPIEVTVKPSEVADLVLSSHPDKTVYEVGEKFDPKGIELLIVYADTTLGYQSVPDDYYSYSPSVITATTTQVVLEFRGRTIALPITVIGGTTTKEETSAPEDSTPTNTTSPEDTTNTPPESSSVETSDISEQTTTDGAETTGGNSSSGSRSALLYVWIILIAIIIVALIVLIIYYKRNFT